MKIKSFPNALTIIVAFIFVAGLLTYIIPKGKYDRAIDPDTQREVVVAGSYKQMDAKNLSPFEILVCIPRGIIKGSEVVAFIFLVGGCFYIVDKTGALKAGVGRLASMMKGKEELALMIVGILFVIGGITEGMQEELIPMMPILLVLTRKLGYTPVVTMSVGFGSAVIGSAFSPINPFGVVIAQKVADVAFLNAIGFRMVVLVIGFAIWMFMIISYAKKNKIVKEVGVDPDSEKLSNSNILILFLIMIGFALLVFGMLALDWGFNEITAEFFALGILIGLLGGLGFNNIFIAYVEGFKEISFAALLVGFAYGISLVLQEGGIIDTIIYGLFTPIEGIPSFLSAIGMMGSQAALHLLVPSYSGQAVLTMPILAPLSDLIGLSRDISVMAYQYGAILMDLIIPTNGALMAMLAIAGVSFNDWFKFIFSKLVIIYFFCSMALFIAVLIGL